jgi:hypothetical protein
MDLISGLINKVGDVATLPLNVLEDVADKVMGEQDQDKTGEKIKKIITGK